MATKLNKYLVIIAAICTIIPLNTIINSGVMNYILLYLPMIIGYMLYFMQYNNYSNKQQKLLKIATCISIVNLLAGLWTCYTSNIHINTFNNISFDMVIAPLVFYFSYFAHRIVSLMVCINLLKNNWTKTKILLTITIVIIAFVLLNVCNQYNYAKIKEEEIFGNNYCAGAHYKGEFSRDIPWKCKLCRYSTEVINPDENVPIICFSCSLSTSRCMECGLLQKD